MIHARATPTEAAWVWTVSAIKFINKPNCKEWRQRSAISVFTGFKVGAQGALPQPTQNKVWMTNSLTGFGLQT